MTDLIKRGNLDADMHTGRLLHEDQGRDWGDATVSHGTPKIFNKPPGARQGTWDRLPWASQEAALPALWLSDF